MVLLDLDHSEQLPTHVLSLESFFALRGMLMEPMGGFAGERERNGIVGGELKRWQESFCREEGEGIPTH
jgi:hypothetical protein